MVLQNHFEFTLIMNFYIAFQKTINRRYCAKFPFQRVKASIWYMSKNLRHQYKVIFIRYSISFKFCPFLSVSIEFEFQICETK